MSLTILNLAIYFQPPAADLNVIYSLRLTHVIQEHHRVQIQVQQEVSAIALFF